MIIKILGPVGVGKSTIAEAVAKELELTYIPEVENSDLKFFRLLQKRNNTQSSEDKMEFQCYTFEQAYARQYEKSNCVIDVPCEQHFIMAKSSLSKEGYKEYQSYYKKYLENLKEGFTFVLKIDFEETIKRIKERGRKEELMSEEEIIFYNSFYKDLFQEAQCSFNYKVIDAESSVEEIVKKIVLFVKKDIIC